MIETSRTEQIAYLKGIAKDIETDVRRARSFSPAGLVGLAEEVGFNVSCIEENAGLMSYWRAKRMVRIGTRIMELLASADYCQSQTRALVECRLLAAVDGMNRLLAVPETVIE